jgi:hypothetical protein
MSSEFLLFIEKLLAVEGEETTENNISPNHSDVLEFLEEYVDDKLFKNIPGRYIYLHMYHALCLQGFVLFADLTSTFPISNSNSI